MTLSLYKGGRKFTVNALILNFLKLGEADCNGIGFNSEE